MNLLLVSHSPERSGAESVMLEVAHEAAAAGWNVTIASPQGDLSRSLPATAKHVEIPSLTTNGEQGLQQVLALAQLLVRAIRAAAILRKAADQLQPVIVSNGLLALPSVIAAAGRRYPVSWLVHDVLASRRRRAIARAVRFRVARSVAVSDDAAEALRGLGYHPLVRVNGVRWPVPAVDPRASTPPVVGQLARLVEWKGQMVLLDAVALLPGVRLVLAGTPFQGGEEYERRLKRRASQPDLIGRVDFPGHVDALAAIAGWDVCAVPSTEPDAGPLAAIEAMSMGVPVVGSTMACYVRDGGGIAVPPGNALALADAIRNVLDDQAIRERLSAHGRALVADRYNARLTRRAMLEGLVAGLQGARTEAAAPR